MGKPFRHKATYLARERLKAAVKVSLPINMSYAEVWLWTNIWVQISQDISASENQVRVKSAGQLLPLPCDGKLTARVVPFYKRDKQPNSQIFFKNLNSWMILSNKNFCWWFRACWIQTYLYLGLTMNYCFTGLSASSSPSWGLAICCPNSKRFLSVFYRTQSFWG